MTSLQEGSCTVPYPLNIPLIRESQGDYPAIGEPVAPTRFVPMKTPMSQEILESWSLPLPCRHPLTVQRLLQASADAGHPISAIIDLANHDCLYAADIPPELEHVTVRLVAKVTPSREAVDRVVAAAAGIWRRRPDAFIAIHCAYGFNRTGFVLCAYLCQVLGMTVDEALAAFAAARPPGVRHTEFVQELRRRYGDEGARADAAHGTPPTPDASRSPRAEPSDCASGRCAGGAGPAHSPGALPPLAPGLPRFPRPAIQASPISGLGLSSRTPSAISSRATSIDSEMHSLGFTSREALQQLRWAFVFFFGGGGVFGCVLVLTTSHYSSEREML